MPHGAKRRRRVLHVAQPVEAGVAVVVGQLAAHQVAHGDDVVVACPPEGALPGWVAEAGATPVAWPATRSPGRSSLDEARRLAAIVAEQRPDLIHLHSSKAGLAGRLAVRGRLPTVFQPHAWSFLAVTGPVHTASLGWERLATRWTDALVAVSADERRIGEQSGVRGHYAVCPNGVDLDRFAPSTPAQRAAARRRLDLPERLTVVCVGRLSRQKGQDVLLEAWRRIAPAATLVLVGDGPDRAALEAAAGGLSVVFAGDTDDVRSWYAAADVFVQPSRWEGASLSVREAMAAGLPVIATDVAGNREIPVIGERCVPAGDVAALAAALRGHLDDPGGGADEGRAARAVAEAHLGLEPAMRAVDTVYADVLGRRRPAKMGVDRNS